MSAKAQTIDYIVEQDGTVSAFVTPTEFIPGAGGATTGEHFPNVRDFTRRLTALGVKKVPDFDKEPKGFIDLPTGASKIAE